MLCYAKSLQSCPTLCDPIDGSPPGSAIPGNPPGKNTGVGCRFLLQCMKVKSESEAAQSCPSPSYPMDCSLPGSSVHGICQARVLEWVVIAFSVLLYYISIKKKKKQQVFVLGVHGSQTFHGVSEEVKPCNHSQRFQRFKYVHQAQIEE